MANRQVVTLCGEDIDRPGHVCAFFESRDEEYRNLAPFLMQGLDKGELVVTIVDEHRRAEHIRLLHSQGVPIESAMESGRLRLLTIEETYLKGGAFEVDAMYSTLHRTLVVAKKQGRRARVSGKPDLTKHPSLSLETFMELEARVNFLVPTFDCTLLCTYDLSKLGGRGVAEALATHPFVILHGRARENPHYIEPLTYLRTRVPASRDRPPRGDAPVA